jgi:hypothetical protein
MSSVAHAIISFDDIDDGLYVRDALMAAMSEMPVMSHDDLDSDALAD